MKASDVISLVTALIVLASTIVSAMGRLPWWVVLLLVLLLTGWASRPVYIKISTTLKERACRRKEQGLVEHHWGDLRRMSTELQGMTLPGTEDIANTIYKFAEHAIPDRRDYYVPYDLKREISYILSIFISLLDLQARHKSVFLWSSKLVESLLSMWHDFVLRRVGNLRKDLKTTSYKLNEHQRDAYEATRKRHNNLVDEYVKFAKRVNEDFGEEASMRTYWEPLPNLWMES